jgi:hypothetical protein
MARLVGALCAERVPDRVCWVSTLLGPEETGVCLGLGSRPGLRVSRMGGLRAWFRLLLENCIVDASIFCNLRFAIVCICSVKFLRAHGGCLGIRSR